MMLEEAYMVGESEGTAARAASFSEEAMEMEREGVMWELRTESRVQGFISPLTITALIFSDLLTQIRLLCSCQVEALFYYF